MRNVVVAILPALLILLQGHTVHAMDNRDTTTAAQHGRIVGRVVDSEEGLPVIGAHIYIDALSRGATSGTDGSFELPELPQGQHTITVSYIGYAGMRREVLVESNRTVELEFSLQPGVHEMGTVVITGSATPYLYTESPVKTEVITHKLIEQTQAVNLAEALSLQTGVSVDNSCQNCNFTQVRILGFDGKYAQVLIDGDPVVSSLAAVYALEHFPDEMIEQIEVVKGGGSALYGGGALSGTINMRTRTPLGTHTRFNYLAQSLKGTLDHKAGAVTEWVSGSKDMGAFLYISARDRGGYDHNGDGFTELGQVSNNTIGVNSYLHVEGYGDFQLSLHHINEARRGGSDLDLLKHEARITEAVDHRRWGGKLRWESRVSAALHLQAHYGFSLLDRDSYYGGLAGDTEQDRLDALRYYGFSKNRTHIAGVRGLLSTGVQDITAGVEYSSDRLVDRSVRDASYAIDALYTNVGMYAQDAITLFEHALVLIAGVRIDRHSELDEAVLSPRINARIELLHELSLRLAYTTGFKAPQVFDEDLHIESLGGVQRVIRNVDGLQPEQSASVSVNLDYNGLVGSTPVLIGLTLFHTRLEDAFTLMEVQHPGEEVILWQRVNSDGGLVRGLELDLGVKPAQSTELRLGGTLKRALFDQPQEVFDGVASDRFLYTPDFQGHLRMTQQVAEGLSMYASLRYTGTMTLPDATRERLVETTDTFIDIDVGGSLRFPLSENTNLELNAGVKNLLDAYQEDLQRGVDRDPGYLYGPTQPRRLYLGVDVIW
ncbi:TonB-dependent receptor [bacterium]|nr:TonB-dependent receptor [bacterium]